MGLRIHTSDRLPENVQFSHRGMRRIQSRESPKGCCMKVTQTSIIDLLGMPGASFIIPPYQRAYAWGEDQCFELWLDIKRAARSTKRHFMGTLVCVRETTDPSEEAVIQVVDGQQRLTTMTLLIAALCQQIKKTAVTVDGMNAHQMAERFLLEGGSAKLTLQRDDAATLDAVVARVVSASESPPPAIPSLNIVNNLRFFEEMIAEAADEGFDVNRIWKAVSSLYLIEASVEDSGQAQVVFESLNSKGRPLNIADLSRNYLLLSESHVEQERLYHEYWRQMEELFAPDPGSLRLNSAIKGWLSVRFRKIRLRSVESVYSGFKQYVEDEYDGTKEDLLREMRGFCLVWAENYRYHAVKKFKSSYDWAINGAPTLTSGYKLKKANNEAYAQRVREELKRVDANW